jgi:hypothetical protein
MRRTILIKSITQLRENIDKALSKQSEALFNSNWDAAKNQCESIKETADILSEEIEEIKEIKQGKLK